MFISTYYCFAELLLRGKSNQNHFLSESSRTRKRFPFSRVLRSFFHKGSMYRVLFRKAVQENRCLSFLNTQIFCPVGKCLWHFSLLRHLRSDSRFPLCVLLRSASNKHIGHTVFFYKSEALSVVCTPATVCPLWGTAVLRYWKNDYAKPWFWTGLP